LKESCSEIVAEVHDLERNVNSLVMEVMVDVLKETSEPLERLVRAALSQKTVSFVVVQYTINTVIPFIIQ